MLEIVEVLLLAVVAIVTAWSGFQAASWDGEQTRLYADATDNRFDAEELDSLAVAELTNDSASTTSWLEASVVGDAELQDVLEKRMTPGVPARRSTRGSRPIRLNNPDAVAGPAKMPEYENPFREKAREINAEARQQLEEGTKARASTARSTSATRCCSPMVLFLAAIAQRFKDPLLRGILNGIALDDPRGGPGLACAAPHRMSPTEPLDVFAPGLFARPGGARHWRGERRSDGITALGFARYGADVVSPVAPRDAGDDGGRGAGARRSRPVVPTDIRTPGAGRRVARRRVRRVRAGRLPGEQRWRPVPRAAVADLRQRLAARWST